MFYQSRLRIKIDHQYEFTDESEHDSNDRNHLDSYEDFFYHDQFLIV